MKYEVKVFVLVEAEDEQEAAQIVEFELHDSAILEVAVDTVKEVVE